MSHQTDLSLLATRVITTLSAAGQTLAVAESLTGGQLAASLTAVPGASTVFRAGIVAYATDLKHRLLGVSEATLAEHGAVSARTCAEMADGAAGSCAADWALATTGVAGPDPQEGHPVGTVYIGVVGPKGDLPGVSAATRTRRLQLSGDRATIQSETVAAVLTLLLDRVGSTAPAT
jgi:nicotinamide-nucleotide amidase